MKYLSAVFVFGLVGVVAGCGGDSSGGGSGDETSAEGLWIGGTGNGRAVTGVILDDGTYWILYSIVGNSNVLGGLVQGDGSSQNGSFTSTNGKDFNLEGLGISSVNVDANYTEEQSFDGIVQYSGTGEEISFDTSYDSDYELEPSLSEIEGSYSGAAATSAGTESATVAFSASGEITGASADGCDYTGTVSPRDQGNIYDLSVTFGGGNCVNGSSTVTGVAYFDAVNQEITSAALNGARTDGFIYVGGKL